jgi:N-acetylneuraminic acid mutarotase
VTGNATLQSAEIIDPVSHAFTSLGNMQSGRNQHTATLLPSGKVLLAAGSSDTSPVRSAELFDPLTNTFSATGSLSTARKSHTATLLANNLVMVAGGKSATGYLKSAEIYDPATGKFRSTGSLNTVRALDTATLLGDQTVLVAGGVSTGGDETDTCELFDPITETFSYTGLTNQKRKRHRAALLLDGTVLIMGGNVLANSQGGGDRETDTAEVYNSLRKTWTSVGKMHAARSEHEATLLSDGTVLVAGGTFTPDPADIYTASTHTFTAVSPMLQARGRHKGILLSNPVWGSLQGKVLEIGGDITGGAVFGGAQQALDTVELYDPSTGQFSLFGTMTVERQNHTATLLNDGRILITGGVGRPFVSATAELVVP